jgi:hypothetical protein
MKTFKIIAITELSENVTLSIKTDSYSAALKALEDNAKNCGDTVLEVVSIKAYS